VAYDADEFATDNAPSSGWQYYGDTPTAVKNRILYLIQKWNFNLPDHGKVREVYAMLKKQGVVFPPHEREDAVQVPAGEVPYRSIRPSVAHLRSFAYLCVVRVPLCVPPPLLLQPRLPTFYVAIASRDAVAMISFYLRILFVHGTQGLANTNGAGHVQGFLDITAPASERPSPLEENDPKRSQVGHTQPLRLPWGCNFLGADPALLHPDLPQPIVSCRHFHRDARAVFYMCVRTCVRVCVCVRAES